jgi:hypothetical protein
MLVDIGFMEMMLPWYRVWGKCSEEEKPTPRVFLGSWF